MSHEKDDEWPETRWACTPPPEGSTYRVLRDEWNADYTIRTILEWEAFRMTDPGLEAGMSEHTEHAASEGA